MKRKDRTRSFSYSCWRCRAYGPTHRTLPSSPVFVRFPPHVKSNFKSATHFNGSGSALKLPVTHTDLYIYNWIACGVCSIIVWFADNVPPSLCSTSACAVQFNCFLHTARACYVTFARQCNAMKQCTCACVMAERRFSAHADVEQSDDGTLTARKPRDPLSSYII